MNKDNVKAVLERGVENIFPNKAMAEKALASDKPLTFYLGIDPTGPSLHLGHAINLKKLGELQKLGHKVILLIGDFTASIGDPKYLTRKPLSTEEIQENFKLYKEQAENFLNFKGQNPTLLLFNSEWLTKLDLTKILELASHMTVEQMLKRDMFEERQKAGRPIFIHEFLYPLLQGYDSVAMEVDGELGGNDQTFNMLVGRQLLKQIKNKEKIVIAMKLLVDSSGKKMGKTEGNMVRLDDRANEMFGKIMSWTDGMIAQGFELCTDVSMAEVEKIKKDLAGGKVNPRDLKEKLASEIVEIYHGKDASEKSQNYFSSAFQKGAPEEIKSVKVKAGSKLVEVLLSEKIIKSKTDFTRLLNEGAISIIEGSKKITDKDFVVKESTNFKIGKRRFLRIEV